MDAEYLTGPQIASLMDLPGTWSILADGLRQIAKAGITATGATRLDAAAEWCRKVLSDDRDAEARLTSPKHDVRFFHDVDAVHLVNRVHGSPIF
jgi:hypothetical protein